MRILQVAPEIEPGSGVGGVAYHLEEAWRRQGVEVERFTLEDAWGGWLPRPGEGLRGKVGLLVRVVWFSVVGTVLARRRVSRGGVDATITHNDVLAGDVYVNHGILRVAMAARGGYAWRMLRNPLHLFTTARDQLRYRTRVHRVVVNLTEVERLALRHTHPHLVPQAVVISNGVDCDRFLVPTPAERRVARGRLGLPQGTTHALFIGHEFDRKGLPLVLDAMTELPECHLTVVGGTPDLLRGLGHRVAGLGLDGRVHVAGRVDDPRPWLQAADLLVLPSAYEANALVVLEAMASGVPVVATPVGYAPEVVTDGVDGWLVERTVEEVRRGIASVMRASPDQRVSMSQAARARAEEHDWSRIAGRYLELLRSLEQGGHQRPVGGRR